MSINSIIETLSKGAASSGFDRVVKFDLGDDGVIVIDGTSVSTDDKPADCTITMSLENMEALAAGDLDPMSAFMQGKIKVDGDMSIAMQLSQLL
jgi:putative sterol carrier protein